MCSSNVSYDCDFFFNDTATTEIYTYCHTLSLHDALPIDTLPVSWSVRPAMMWSSVDLPQPERPSRAAMLHDGTVRSMSRRTRSEEHTSELQSLMRISYAVCCLKKKNVNTQEPLSHIIISVDS